MKDANATETALVAETLVDIGLALIQSGANTSRVHLITNRFMQTLGYEGRISIAHLTLYISIRKDNASPFFTVFKQADHYGVDFAKISRLRRLSWQAAQESWSFAQVREALDAREHTAVHPLWMRVLGCGIFSACLCRLFGGEIMEILISFLAASTGFWLRARISVSLGHPSLTLFCAALSSSLIAGFFLFNPSLHFAANGIAHDTIFISSLLYLVPGVPLVNALTDFVDGFILNGIVRLTNAMLHLFFCSLAISLALFFYTIMIG